MVVWCRRKLGCLNDFTDRRQLAYCLESPLDYAGTKLRCRYQDALGVQTLMTDSIGIGTRGVEREQVGREGEREADVEGREGEACASFGELAGSREGEREGGLDQC